jgi:hypothetical protein
LKTSPEAVLGDIEKLMKMAGLENVLPEENTTIIKDNISRHFRYLSANATPWQLEGVILTLLKNPSLQSRGWDFCLSFQAYGS